MTIAIFGLRDVFTKSSILRGHFFTVVWVFLYFFNIFSL